MEPQSLDVGRVRWGEVQGALKVESAQKNKRVQCQPKWAHLTELTEDAHVPLGEINCAVRARETAGLAAVSIFILGVGRQESRDILLPNVYGSPFLPLFFCYFTDLGL